MEERHPFVELTLLIGEWKEKRNSFDIKQLQDFRERLALSFFYISDGVGQVYSNHLASEHSRKQKYAERVNFHRKNSSTISESENTARLDTKKEADTEIETLKQKERVKIVVEAVKQILNSVSTRISQISK